MRSTVLVFLALALLYGFPAAFIMTRRMLLGLKERAERLRALRTAETHANQRSAA